jgi:hypothetical protein
MPRDASERYHQIIEFQASDVLPGFVELVTGYDRRNTARLCFSLPDLAVLRARIDELLGVPPCGPCEEGRHEDCPRHHNASGEQAGYRCGCDQRRMHSQVIAAQIAFIRASRGR